MAFAPNVGHGDFSRFLEISFQTAYAEALLNSYYIARRELWGQTVTMIPSTGLTEDLGYDDAMPMPSEITDDNYKIYGFSDFTQSVSASDYGLKVRIHKNLFADERKGEIQRRFNKAAAGHPLLMEENWANLLVNGDSTTGFDGQNYFGSGHWNSMDNSDQNKVISIAGMSSNGDNILAVRDVMRAFTDSDGEPLNINPTHIITGLGDTSNAVDIMTSSRSGWPGTANNESLPAWVNALTHIETPKISSATAWYLLDCSKSEKPLGLMERQNLEVTISPPDAHTDYYLAKSNERYKLFHGPWYLSIKGNS